MADSSVDACGPSRDVVRGCTRRQLRVHAEPNAQFFVAAGLYSVPDICSASFASKPACAVSCLRTQEGGGSINPKGPATLIRVNITNDNRSSNYQARPRPLRRGLVPALTLSRACSMPARVRRAPRGAATTLYTSKATRPSRISSLTTQGCEGERLPCIRRRERGRQRLPLLTPATTNDAALLMLRLSLITHAHSARRTGRGLGTLEA